MLELADQGKCLGFASREQCQELGGCYGPGRVYRISNIEEISIAGYEQIHGKLPRGSKEIVILAISQDGKHRSVAKGDHFGYLPKRLPKLLQILWPDAFSEVEARLNCLLELVQEFGQEDMRHSSIENRLYEPERG